MLGAQEEAEGRGTFAEPFTHAAGPQRRLQV
jgi:hypothetical protein